MKINYIPNHNDRRLSKINVGDTFLYPANGSSKIYIKIADFNGIILGGVDLETGICTKFPEDLIVRKVNSEVLIKN